MLVVKTQIGTGNYGVHPPLLLGTDFCLHHFKRKIEGEMIKSRQNILRIARDRDSRPMAVV